MLQHYTAEDIKFSGMSKQAFAKLLTDSLTVMEKWKTVKPYWEDAYFTENVVFKIAKMIFHDNAIEILKPDKQ
jgi:hypothetical protein